MRLLIISNLFWPDHAGGASIYTDFAVAMSARGHNVTVRCAFPYFPEWQDKTGENGWRIKREQLDGVTVERFGLFLPQAPQGLRGRLAFEGSHLASLARSLPRGTFDAALVFATHPSSTGFGALLRRLRRLPLWINVQDLASDAARATGLLESSRTDRVIRRLDQLMLGQANVLSGISPGMVERLRQLCPEADVRYLPNWLHRTMAEEVDATTGKVRPPIADGPIRLLYAGNVGGKQDLLRLCRTLAASSVRFRFRIHAAGSGAGALRDWAVATADSRFELGPIIPERQFVEALRECHLFVISETEGSGHSYAPSKLLPALATETPVLAVSDAASSIGIEVRTHDIGLAVEWAALNELPARVAALQADPEPLDRWRTAATARSVVFDRDRLIAELAEGVEALPATRLSASRRR